MIHNECNSGRQQYMCHKQNGQCSKGFPQPYVPATCFNEESRRCHCRRRSPEDGGNTAVVGGRRAADANGNVARIGGRNVTNEWVAKYSPYLLEKYDCHNYWDVCHSPKAVKYLCKYMTKGPDFAMVGLAPTAAGDEIAEYINMRYTGTCEAAWRLFGYPTTDFKPAITRVGVHLEGEDMHVAPDDPDFLERFAETLPRSQLLAWMEKNRQLRDGQDTSDGDENLDGRDLDSHDGDAEEMAVERGYLEQVEEVAAGDLAADADIPDAEAAEDDQQLMGDGDGRPRRAGAEDEQDELDEDNHDDIMMELPMFGDVCSLWWWESSRRRWRRRRRQQRFHTLTRVFNVHPGAGELFFMRVLATQAPSTRGARTHQEFRTVNGRVCATYGEACELLGLADNDRYLFNVMREAATFQFSASLRGLFVVLLVLGDPVDANALFQEFWDDMSEDFLRAHPQLTELQRRQLAYMDIQRRLQATGRDFVVEEPDPALAEQLLQFLPGAAAAAEPNRLIAEQLNYDRLGLRQRVVATEAVLNAEQRDIVAEVQQLDHMDGSKCMCILAGAGTGKTKLLNHLLDMNRAEGRVAIAVSCTGITARQLDGGTTFHSRFRCPLDISDGVTLPIGAGTQLAQLLQRAWIIVWDEISMAHKNMMTALDKALRDICRETRLHPHPTPFAGKLVVIAGDFRQILPIDKWDKSMGADVVVKKCDTWGEFRQRRLRTNMRLQLATAEDRAYREWVDALGNGDLQGRPSALVQLPEGTVGPADDEVAIEWVYPHFEESYRDVDYLKGRLLMVVFNSARIRLSQLLCARIPGQEFVSYSWNAVSEEFLDEYHMLPPEFMASLDPPNFPPHTLSLKRDMAVMLIRNLDVASGLCNGARLMVREVRQNPWLLVASFLDDPHTNIFIPRIRLIVEEEHYGFRWSRVQFPVIPAYVATINKAQGQTLDRAGVFLEDPVFSHGQLYTAATRTRRAANIRFFIPQSDELDDRQTTNVVLHEVLQ
eukprot:GHVU01121782.1.p1 GENE.GHVU01121782.1~~GHVU01121782.1.p1  ORF type:complete len:996 (+),score=129.29 GHVU01121782.1:2365-5352(+)